MLGDWLRKKKFYFGVMEELVDFVKLFIDKNKRKYFLCVVVGNSGILLIKEFGELIDIYEVVIWLNNVRIEFYKKNVGLKISILFVNSNILYFCVRRDDCYCYLYGVYVLIVMYMC